MIIIFDIHDINTQVGGIAIFSFLCSAFVAKEDK